MAFKKILFRRDTAANWTSINPTLSIGEIGYETDTGRIKIGNGSSVWTSLEYFVGNLPGASLNDLGDVVISEASDGDFLRWDGTKWINDAVNLSTDTVGNYMVDISGGTGVIVTHTPGEGSTASVAIGQDVGTSSSVTFAHVSAELSGNVVGDLTGNADTASSLETSRKISLGGDLSGSVSFDGSNDVTITASIQPDSVALGTDTTGNFMSNVVAGTGVTVTHTPGESSSASIAIGQDVSTSASVTFGQVTTTGDVVVGGNFTVNGTSTTLNTETLAVEDNIIVLNANTIGSPILNAGIEVERGDSPNVSIRWNESTDKWEITNDGSDYSNVVDLDYLNAKIAEEHYHRSVWLASTTPLSGSPVYTNGTIDEDGGYGIGATLESSVNEELVVDGEVPYVGARIGVFGQSNAIKNGIYVVTELGGPSSIWVLTRADDANGSFPNQLKRGETIPVAWGATNAIQAFGVSSDGSAAGGGHVFGTDEINFVQVSGTAQLLEGLGIEFTGNTISLAEYSSSVISGSPALEFVRDVSVDAYGRVAYVERSSLASIQLGTDTSGNYIETIIAGTGIILNGQNGESASPTIEIAQDVSTSASVTFSHVDVTTLSVSSLLDAPNANFTTVSASSFVGDLEAISASASNFYGDLEGNVTGSLEGNVVGNLSGDVTGNVTGNLTGDVTGNLIGNVTGNLSGSATYSSFAASLLNPRTISLTGDLSGSVSFDGSGDVNISALVQPDSIALGVDTAGNYVADVVAGAGIGVIHEPGEGSSATIELNAGIGSLKDVFIDPPASYPTDGQFLRYNSASLGWVAADVPIINSFDDVSDVSISAVSSGDFIKWSGTAWINDQIDLGSDTVGDYVQGLVAGTGVTLSNNSGEGSTPTIAIGQDVSSSASPTFGQITLSNAPSSGSDAATKEYVDEVAQGLQAKPAVKAATTENISGTYDNGLLGVGATLTATSNGQLPEIDGVSDWEQYDGILLKDQTDKAENGRWVVWVVGDTETPWQLRRCGLCDEANEIPGAYIFVFGGSTNVNNGYVLSVDDPSTFVVGTDDINVIQFSGAGQVIAGAGLNKNGNELFIDGTVVTLSDTQTLLNKTLSSASLVTPAVGGQGAFFNGETSGYTVLRASATAGSATITLPAVTGTVVTTGDSGTVTGSMIADGTISNSDIGATAGISLSKLESGTSAQVVVANNTGVPTFTSISGDVTISSSGVTAIGSGVVTDSDISSTANIARNKIADITTNQQTGNYTLVLADKNKLVEMNVGSANNLTVPPDSSVAFPIGTQITILQVGTGQTTVVAGSGVTVNATPGLKTRTQWSLATLVKRGTDTWVLVGDIAA